MLYAFFWVIPRRLNYPEENIQHSEHGGSLKSRIGLKIKGKGKAIPLQAWTGPEGSRRLRLPDFKTIGT